MRNQEMTGLFANTTEKLHFLKSRKFHGRPSLLVIMVTCMLHMYVIPKAYTISDKISWGNLP